MTDYQRTPIEEEVHNRIKLSLYAYAYEMENDSLITDDEFDQRALGINPEMRTGNEEMDEFFRTRFSPHTGQWIHHHPDIAGLADLYKKYYAKEEN